MKTMIILASASLALTACVMPHPYAYGTSDGYYESGANANSYQGEAVVSTSNAYSQPVATVYAQPATSVVVNDGFGHQGASVTVSGVNAYGASNGYYESNSDAYDVNYQGNSATVYSQSSSAAYGQPLVSVSAGPHGAYAGAGPVGASVTVTGFDNYGSSDGYYASEVNVYDSSYQGGTAVVYAQAPPSNVIVHQQAPWQSQLSYNRYEFDALLGTLRDVDFDNSRLEVLQRSARGAVFSIQQVSELIECFDFENNRVEAAVALYSRTVDAKNWHLIRKSLDFDSSFSTIEKRISGLRPIAY